MIKDKFLKLICIPTLGILIPLLSRLLQFDRLHLVQIISSFVFFIITSHIVWQGSVYLLAKLRNIRFKENIYLKLFTSVLITFFFSVVIVGLSILVWQNAFLRQVETRSLFVCCGISGGVVILFALLYEILFLNRERELDNQVVMHLDKELLEAEINVLKNELDPHFVYNTLMPLYYLIKNDVARAELFANKLIQVYQYFLENRQNDFIPLSEELKFIKNYFYLLEIRFNKSVMLSVNTSIKPEEFMVLPFSLQVLVENAIKHNELQMESPLEIMINIGPDHLTVSNSLRSRMEAPASSKIGLNNLRARYKILFNSDISVIRTREIFAVKLPLKRKIKADDLDNYHRGRSYQF